MNEFGNKIFSGENVGQNKAEQDETEKEQAEKEPSSVESQEDQETKTQEELTENPQIVEQQDAPQEKNPEEKEHLATIRQDLENAFGENGAQTEKIKEVDEEAEKVLSETTQPEQEDIENTTESPEKDLSQEETNTETVDQPEDQTETMEDVVEKDLESNEELENTEETLEDNGIPENSELPPTLQESVDKLEDQMTEEAESLRQVPDDPERPKRSRLKKAMLILTAGTMLWASSMPGTETAEARDLDSFTDQNQVGKVVKEQTDELINRIDIGVIPNKQMEAYKKKAKDKVDETVKDLLGGLFE